MTRKKAAALVAPPPQQTATPPPSPPRQLSPPAVLTPSTTAASSTPILEPTKRQDLVSEFVALFGLVSKLVEWQDLCRDFDLEGDLGSIKKCKKALNTICVNIFDVVDAKKVQKEGEKLNVKKFKNRRELLRYTQREKKFFPRNEAKAKGPMRALLKQFTF